MVALRPPPRRHLSKTLDRDNVDGTIPHPAAGDAYATPIATIVVDAHPAFRAGVAQLLDDDFMVAGTASSVAELERVSAAAPHARLVVIGEIPDGDLRQAVNAIPHRARFVVFANEANRDHVLWALQLGASGYLLKSIRGRRLSTTLRAIMRGARADDESLTALVEEFLERRARRGYVVLPSGMRVPVSPREQQVANLLARSLSTAAIADELGISVVTVRRHVSALMRKLDVANRDMIIRLLAA